jgi:hypothetical protein
MIEGSMSGGARHGALHTQPTGGAHHGLASLTQQERLAAQSALSRISSGSSGLGAKLGAITQNATLAGGSVKAAGLTAPALIHGSGSDTFLGGAHSAMATSIGNDTVVSGSTVRGVSGVEALGTHHAPNITLSSDTINVAGATAASLKTMQPDETKAKPHTVSVGEKTTVTISGLSPHDVAKLPH